MTRSSSHLKGKAVVSSSSGKGKDVVVDMTGEASDEEVEVPPTSDENAEVIPPPAQDEAGEDVEEKSEEDGGSKGIPEEILEGKMTDQDWSPNGWHTIVREKHIEGMRVKFSVPEFVTMRPSEEGEIPGRPRPGEVAFCRSFFLAGVRLPLLPLFRQFLSFCRAAPFQINPNVWKAMVSCVVL